jgi:hypothetical protein
MRAVSFLRCAAFYATANSVHGDEQRDPGKEHDRGNQEVTVSEHGHGM